MLKKALQESPPLPYSWEIEDFGPASMDAVDYPDYAFRLGAALQEGMLARGLLICGSGIGMSIAVNRFSKVRGALCNNAAMAQLARQHNDANCLILGARMMKPEEALMAMTVFLETPFEGGRHQRRVDKLGHPHAPTSAK